MNHFFSLLITVCLSTSSLVAQDFGKDISTAKTAYTAGKLEESHFALLQALQEIDIRIGQEVLKLLPQLLDTMKVNPKDDQVTGNMGFVGTTIRRTYGKAPGGELTIIGNSPFISSLNALLNAPLVGGLMNDANHKIVRIQGYKGRMEKSTEENGENYSLEIPLNNSLITLKAYHSSESLFLKLAETIPFQQIARLIQ